MFQWTKGKSTLSCDKNGLFCRFAPPNKKCYAISDSQSENMGVSDVKTLIWGDIFYSKIFAFLPQFVLHQKFSFFTPMFYTKIFEFFTPKILLLLHQFFPPKILLFLHKFVHQKFYFFYTNFFYANIFAFFTLKYLPSLDQYFVTPLGLWFGLCCWKTTEANGGWS